MQQTSSRNGGFRIVRGAAVLRFCEASVYGPQHRHLRRRDSTDGPRRPPSGAQPTTPSLPAVPLFLTVPLCLDAAEANGGEALARRAGAPDPGGDQRDHATHHRSSAGVVSRELIAVCV
eukprot:gene21018-25255_t